MDKKVIVYRIYDPVEKIYCESGRGLYAKNGRSIWIGKTGAAVAKQYMPNKERLEVRAFRLVPLEDSSDDLYICRDGIYDEAPEM